MYAAAGGGATQFSNFQSTLNASPGYSAAAGGRAADYGAAYGHGLTGSPQRQRDPAGDYAYPRSAAAPASPRQYEQPAAQHYDTTAYDALRRLQQPAAQHGYAQQPQATSPTHGRRPSAAAYDHHAAAAHPRVRTPPPLEEPAAPGYPTSTVALNPYNMGATSYKQASQFSAYGSSRGGYQSAQPAAARAGAGAGGTQFVGAPVVGAAPSGTRGQRSQRIRGQSFKNEWTAGGGAGPRGRRQRAPSMVGAAGQHMLPPQRPEDHGKKVVVLDLDETLVYARDGPLYARPGLHEFLALLGQRTEGVAWTAGVRAYAQAVVRNIDKEGHLKHCVYRHAKWFSGGAGYTKDLKLLGRDMDQIIIVENTPDCIRYYPDNSILLADYERDERNAEAQDSTLPVLTQLISQLINSQQTVPQFLRDCPMLRKKSVETDMGDYITVNFLDVNDVGLAADHQRVNRDLSGR